MDNKLHKPVTAPVRPARTLAVAPFEGFDRSNCLAVQQEIIDDQLAGFTEGELKVMLAITRATNGGQREGVPLSVRVLCEGSAPEALPGRGTGLSPRTVQAACTALETAGFLRINRRMAPDGSGLPSLFTLPLVVPGMHEPGRPASARFPGYSAGRRVRLPMLVLDRLMSELSGAELKVLLYVLRHTFCVGVADEIMPMARLVENTGLSLRHTRLAVTGLTARGVIVVLHRQDAERGKLASRFGVKVIGEAQPFTVKPAVPVRAARPEEPAERPVWLVPSAEPVPGVETPIVAETVKLPPMIEITPEPISVLQVVAPPIQPVTPIVSAVPPTPIIVAQSQAPRQSSPPVRAISPAMIKDDNPVWAAVKKLLSERLPYQVFLDRIAPASSVGDEGPDVLVAVTDEYHRWWLESKLSRQVHEALEDSGFGDIHIQYLNFASGSRSDVKR